MKECLPKSLILFMAMVMTCTASFAQKTVRPKVFIYGSTMASFAAAIQCAQSDVPVAWALDSEELIANLDFPSFAIDQRINLSGGIWMDLLMLIARHELPNDSIAEHTNKNITTQIFKNSLQELVAKQKNLTVLKNTSVRQLSEAKNGWDVVLKNKEKYSVRAVFDGSQKQVLSTFLESTKRGESLAIKPIEQITKDEIRTVVASGQHKDTVYALTFKELLASQYKGFYSLNDDFAFQRENSFPSVSNLGQAIGAMMAYTAFFKVPAEKINIRVLQGELLKFRSRLLPYEDVLMEDPNFSNIQRFGLSGIFLGDKEEGNYRLLRQKEVQVEEVKAPILKYFSRSQLWFTEKSLGLFMANSFFELIKLISFKDVQNLDNRNLQLDKDQKSHALADSEEAVNRYDFAVMFESYCKAFDVAIDAQGTILR